MSFTGLKQPESQTGTHRPTAVMENKLIKSLVIFTGKGNKQNLDFILVSVLEEEAQAEDKAKYSSLNTF